MMKYLSQQRQQKVEEMLHVLIEKGMEYPEVEWQVQKKTKLDSETIRAIYDQTYERP